MYLRAGDSSRHVFKSIDRKMGSVFRILHSSAAGSPNTITISLLTEAQGSVERIVANPDLAFGSTASLRYSLTDFSR